jgi:hypothetical protein
MRNLPERAPILAWQAEHLRMTAFPSPAASLGNQSWWADLVGDSPETVISRPRMGGVQAAGPFEGKTLVLSVEAARIDWRFSAIADPVGGGEQYPLLGPFSEALAPFNRIMLRWLEMSPPIQRIAFGAVLFLPVESRQAGYRQLTAYLPGVRLDPDGSSDFLYQINRPRDSRCGIPGLRLNRLSKWSVAYWAKVGLSVGPGVLGYSEGPPEHSCRLELDINTVPDFQGELPQGQLPQLYQELVDLGSKIVEQGDIP